MKGSYLKSESGAYKLILQQNGNLEIVCKNTSVWSTNTFDSDINSMRFDDFGVIGLRKSSSSLNVWSSLPHWEGTLNPDSLIMQDDGNLRAFERELISNEKRQFFATNSFGKCPAGNIFFSFRLCYAMRKKCPYSELFWSAFSRIWTEYGEVLRISPYSVRMRENADQNNSKYGHFLH